ncbi:PAS domain-containing protein [Streptomyces chartreusis]
MRDLSFHWDSGELPEPEAEANALVGTDGRVAGWSTGAAELLDYQAKDVLGHPATDLMHRRMDTAFLQRRTEAGTRRLGPVALRHSSGKRVDAEVWVRPITSATGAFMAVPGRPR